MKRRSFVLILALALALAAAPTLAQAPAGKLEFMPGAQYDPAIPTLKQVTGHEWGEKITAHHDIERYIEALAKASPRVRVVKYAETHEGRALACDTPARLKQRLTGAVIGVVTPDPRGVRRALEGAEGIEAAVLTGDGVHLVVDSADRLAAVRARLAQAGVPFAETREVTPTIEDLFVASVEGKVELGEERAQ